MKKLANTMKKTEDKMSYLLFMEKTLRNRIENKENKQRQLDYLKQKNKNTKDNLSANIKSLKNQNLSKSKQQYNNFSQQRSKNLQESKCLKIAIYNNNRLKYDFVKTQRMSNDEKQKAIQVNHY